MLEVILPVWITEDEEVERQRIVVSNDGDGWIGVRFSDDHSQVATFELEELKAALAVLKAERRRQPE